MVEVPGRQGGRGRLMNALKLGSIPSGTTKEVNMKELKKKYDEQYKELRRLFKEEESLKKRISKQQLSILRTFKEIADEKAKLTKSSMEDEKRRLLNLPLTIEKESAHDDSSSGISGKE